MKKIVLLGLTIVIQSLPMYGYAEETSSSNTPSPENIVSTARLDGLEQNSPQIEPPSDYPELTVKPKSIGVKASQ